MAYPQEMQAKFVELRVQGWTFDKIAEELKVAKTTLLNWQGLHAKTIADLEFFDLQTLFESHKLTRHLKIDTNAAMLEKIDEGLKARDLNKDPIKELLNMRDYYDNNLRRLTGDCRGFTGELPHELAPGDKEKCIRLE